MSEDRATYKVSSHTGTLKDLAARPCARLHSDPEYQPPTPDEIRLLRDVTGWSQVDLARLAGVSFKPGKGSTTVRKWCAPVGSPEHRAIPYAAWRLLLIYAGVASAAEADQVTGYRAASAPTVATEGKQQ